MVNQRSRKPGRKAPPRVEDIAHRRAPGEPATNERSSDEVGTDEAGTDEAGTDAASSNESSSPEVGTEEVGTDEASTDEASSDEASSDEASSGELATDALATDEAVIESDEGAPETDERASPGPADVASDDPSPDASHDLPDEVSPEPHAAPADVTPAVGPELADMQAAEPSAAALDESPDPAAGPHDESQVDDGSVGEVDEHAALDPGDPLAAMLAEFDAPRPVAPGVQLTEEIPIDPEDDLRAVEGEASLRLVSILESLLFAAARPLRVQDLRKVLAETSKHQIQLALKHLMAVTRERGVVLAQVAGGFQFRTHPDNAVWVQKMLQAKPARLSRTQIETLAIVAYRQPITRPEIDDVRGVDSGAVLKTLLERELIQIVGRKEEPGRPLLYGTTVRFLEFFNLRSLRDLPTLRDFRDLSEESKATVRAKFGESEAEALGQGVLGLDGEDEPGEPGEPGEAAADVSTTDASEAAEDVSKIDAPEASPHPDDATVEALGDDAPEANALPDDAVEAPADDAVEAPADDASEASSLPDGGANDSDADAPGGRPEDTNESIDDDAPEASHRPEDTSEALDDDAPGESQRDDADPIDHDNVDDAAGESLLDHSDPIDDVDDAPGESLHDHSEHADKVEDAGGESLLGHSDPVDAVDDAPGETLHAPTAPSNTADPGDLDPAPLATSESAPAPELTTDPSASADPDRGDPSDPAAPPADVADDASSAEPAHADDEQLLDDVER